MYKFKTPNDLAKVFEYTNLKNTISESEFLEFLKHAKEFTFHGVVVAPSFVKLAKKELKNTDMKIITVIGFPFGFETTEMKIANTKIALDDGADEIDMVINLSDIKSGKYESIEEEIKSIKEILSDKTLKVIVESNRLTDDEKVKISKTCEHAGADYIKTSTGFNGLNTPLETIHDIKLIKKNAPLIKIKASGNINTYKDAYQIVSTSVDKIGSSSAYEIIKDFEKLINNEDIKREPLRV